MEKWYDDDHLECPRCGYALVEVFVDEHFVKAKTLKQVIKEHAKLECVNQECGWTYTIAFRLDGLKPYGHKEPCPKCNYKDAWCLFRGTHDICICEHCDDGWIHHHEERVKWDWKKM